jgi:hypothetical protein
VKISLTITALIVFLFVFFGGQIRQRLDRARENHDRILAEATGRGIEAVASDETTTLSSTTTARIESQKAREAKAREAARKLAIFGNDRDAVGAMGPEGDQAKQLDFLEGMAEATELDPAGLKLLLSELIANDKLTDEMRGNFIMMVGFHMSDKNPLGALDLLAASGDRLQISGVQIRSIVGVVLQKLAANDPGQALEWLQRQTQDHPEMVNADTRAAVLAGIAKSDPGLAFSTLVKFGLTGNPAALESIGAGAETVEQRSSVLAAMRDYAATSRSEEEQQIAMKNTLAGMARRLSRDGFDSASKWLETANLSPDEAAGLAGNIDTSFAKSDTGKWIDWMSANVPADQLGVRVDEMMKFWTGEDYRAAGTWLDSAPEGPAKQAAVKSYSSAVASFDPAAASQWAQTLPEGDDRTALMKNIYSEWKKQDEAAAAKFAKDNGIGE